MSSPRRADPPKGADDSDPAPRVIQAPPQGSSDATGPENALSAQARDLAGKLQAALAQDGGDAVSAEALMALMAPLCSIYAAQVEGGSDKTPVAEGQSVSPTGLMVTAGGLLRAGNLAVFELGMWQSWTGR